MKKHTRPAFILIGFLFIESILYLYADRPTALFMHEQDAINPDIINFFRSITDLGKSVWYLPPCALVTLFCAFLSRGKDVTPAYRRLFSFIGVRALFVFATIGVSGIVADIIKPIAGRARPILFLREHIYGFSPFTAQGSLWNGMPSGHSTTAFALAFSLAILSPRLRVLWFACAIILASSRVIVDAHYLSDVCAGAMLGWLTTRMIYQHGMFRVGSVIFPIDSLSSKG